MPTIRRSRTLAVAPAEIWAVVADPRRLPDWWPDVVRVEDVAGDVFTQVLKSGKGRPVRADYRVVESQAPTALRWTQSLPGTPFERFMRASAIVFVLKPAVGGGTRVTLSLEQRLHGLARFGGFMVRRAGRRRLDAALGALEDLLA